MEIEGGLLISFNLLRIRFAMQHSVRPSVSLRRLHLKFASRKCEQVSRNRLRFTVADAHSLACFVSKSFGRIRQRFPICRDRQFQSETSLEVRLIEAGKSKMCASRYK